MKKAGAVLFPLLVIAWIVSVVNPDLIPGTGYASSYILPLIVIFGVIRVVSAAKKNQLKQAQNRPSVPVADPPGPNVAPTGSDHGPTAAWTPPPGTAPQVPPGPPTRGPAMPTRSAYAPPSNPAAPHPATPAPVAPPESTDPPTGVDALPADLVARLRELRTGGRTIEAVELLREHTGMELYEASRLVIGLDADS